MCQHVPQQTTATMLPVTMKSTANQFILVCTLTHKINTTNLANYLKSASDHALWFYSNILFLQFGIIDMNIRYGLGIEFLI
jgi:hypothetical protein